MTVKEIAEAYDISTSTVRQRINAGKSESEIIAPTKKKYLVENPCVCTGFYFTSLRVCFKNGRSFNDWFNGIAIF